MKSTDRQMSESFRIAVILALSGGVMDGYTYFLRGGVFANAVTGNIILLGLSLFAGDYHRAVQYFIPICTFSVGIFVAALMRDKLQHKLRAGRLHWRQTVVLVEIVFLALVSLIPLGKLDIVANSTVTFVSALQFETFKKVRGDAYASLFCTGNLRSAMEQLYLGFSTHDKAHFFRGIRYIAIIVIFTIGVVLCAALVPSLEIRTIYVSILLLLAACILMYMQE